MFWIDPTDPEAGGTGHTVRACRNAGVPVVFQDQWTIWLRELTPDSTMETFAPGDRVVAINTDHSGPILAPRAVTQLLYNFPDGPLRSDQVYHIAGVESLRDQSQGVFLTGLRVLHGTHEISWHHSRFRKVDTLRDHAPKKRIRRRPTPAKLPTPAMLPAFH